MTDARAPIAGVLLAAGRGRRMGQCKQLLPWGSSTIVASAFDAIAGVCNAGMILVVGDQAEGVVAALEDRAFHVVRGDSDSEQLASVRLGLQRAMEIPSVQWILLHLADHPRVPGGVLDSLLDRARQQRKVLIPTVEGHGGHPILLPIDIAESIVTWAGPEPSVGEGGLRACWAAHPEWVERIEFPGASDLVRDLDTVHDYAAARRAGE